MMKKREKKSEFKREVEDVESWIIERRKFFIKLLWVVGLIAALLIISHFYLRVNGLSLW